MRGQHTRRAVLLSEASRSRGLAGRESERGIAAGWVVMPMDQQTDRRWGRSWMQRCENHLAHGPARRFAAVRSVAERQGHLRLLTATAPCVLGHSQPLNIYYGLRGCRH